MKPENVTRTAVEIASTAAFLLLASRVIFGPDSTRTLVMRLAKSGENFCESQAVLWARRADGCANLYKQIAGIHA